MQLPVIWLNRIPFYKYLSPSLLLQTRSELANTRCELQRPSEFHLHLRIHFPLLCCFIPIVCDQPYHLLPGFSISNTKLESSFMTTSVEKELRLVSL